MLWKRCSAFIPGRHNKSKKHTPSFSIKIWANVRLPGGELEQPEDGAVCSFSTASVRTCITESWSELSSHLQVSLQARQQLSLSSRNLLTVCTLSPSVHFLFSIPPSRATSAIQLSHSISRCTSTPQLPQDFGNLKYCLLHSGSSPVLCKGL